MAASQQNQHGQQGSPGRELYVLTVCGVGMGSSLMLRMNAEKALERLGVAARVEHSDLSGARSTRSDVVIGQGMHTEELEGTAPVIISIINFMDIDGLTRQLADALQEEGWL